MTTFEPSQPVAAFGAACFTAKHALSLVTDQTSLETAMDAIKEAMMRSLLLSPAEIALTGLLRDQDELSPPSLDSLLWRLRVTAHGLRQRLASAQCQAQPTPQSA